MIDRQETDQLLKELEAQAMAGNRDMASPMGTLNGADYLVYGSLASFGVEDKTLKLPGSSRLFKHKIGHAEGNMRIVDTRSGDILESRKITVSRKVNLRTKGSRTVVAMADAFAEQVALMLMNSIYPIKVAHVGSDGTAYINRGNDGGLSAGETLEVFRPGPPIIDPDTGVRLGFEETPIGQVSITEVENARSKGVLIDGTGLARGDLLKRTLQNKGKRATVARAERQSAPVRTGGQLSTENGRGQQGAPLKKATLAMGVMRYRSSANTDGIKNARNMIGRMSDDMIQKLVNTRRFTVMERREVDQILDEKAFDAVASGGDIEERLRELEGADYLIHGEVANFYIKTVSKRVPYLDRIESKTTGTVEGMCRIVDVHSGRVISAEKVRIDEEIDLPEAYVEITSRLMDRYTTKAVSQIVARLFPIKVLGASADGTVYLNRGVDGGLEKGTRFDVMRSGEELIDPDTGRSFFYYSWSQTVF
jgi:curli biogenesis system outer membrane secretion channel CsgG